MKILKIENSWNPLYKRIVLEATEDKRCVWDSLFGPRVFTLKKGKRINILMSRSEYNRTYPVVGEYLNFADVARMDFQRSIGGHQIPWRFEH